MLPGSLREVTNRLSSEMSTLRDPLACGLKYVYWECGVGLEEEGWKEGGKSLHSTRTHLDRGTSHTIPHDENALVSHVRRHNPPFVLAH